MHLVRQRRRKARSRVWTSLRTSALAAAAAAARGVNGNRELRHIPPLEAGDLAGALLVDLVDPNDRVHRQVRPLDAPEFRLDLLFRRVDDHGTALTEYELFHLDKAKQGPVTHVPGVDLVHLALAH